MNHYPYGVASHGGVPLRFHLTDLSLGGDGEGVAVPLWEGAQ